MLKKIFSLFVVILFAVGATAQTNQDLYFVFLNTNPDKAVLSENEVENLQTAHLNNIDRLAEEGKLFAAGPFDGGGGMFILHAESMDEAKQYLNSDPAVQANRYVLEIYPFKLAHGNMCGAEKPYEMVTYQMVRLISTSKTGNKMPEVTYDNRIFMGDLQATKSNIVAQGSFVGQNDGVLILKNEDENTAEKIIKKHPSVRSGDLKYEVKTLWIAKGTFCE